MSVKLKAFSILAKKIREVYLGWSAGRQMLAIPCNFLARSIHRHFFPLLRLMSHSDHLLHAKNKSCIFWTPAKKRCKITNNGMWLNSTVHLHSNMLLGWKYSIPRNHFWTDLTYLLQVQENVYDTLLLLVLFSINVSGDGNSPLPSQCARPDGAAWPKKQKRVWPQPPSDLCIHHCLNSCASRVCASRSREKICAAISFWGNSTRPTGLGMNENKGVRRIVFSITS